MRTGVKICGLTDPAAVAAALRGGADYLGFVLFERSPRSVGPEAAAALARPARDGRSKTVAVMVDPDDALLDAVAESLRPDLVQLHGTEDARRVLQVRARTGAAVIKACPVEAAEEIEAALRRFEAAADHLLFEGRAPEGADRPGGNASRAAPEMFAAVRTRHPWFLAGGLDPTNVAETLKASGAPLLDVSSGVERAPGIKDGALISAFLSAARGARARF